MFYRIFLDIQVLVTQHVRDGDDFGVDVTRTPDYEGLVILFHDLRTKRSDGNGGMALTV